MPTANQPSAYLGRWTGPSPKASRGDTGDFSTPIPLSLRPPFESVTLQARIPIAVKVRLFSSRAL